MVVDEKTVPCSRGPDDDSLDLSLLELKADVTGRVLVEGQRSLEWPVDQRKNIRNINTMLLVPSWKTDWVCGVRSWA